MEHPSYLGQIQDSLVEIRAQLMTVDRLAAALEHGGASDVGAAHRTIRGEVERLEGLTERLFDLSCTQAGIRPPPGLSEVRTAI